MAPKRGWLQTGDVDAPEPHSIINLTVNRGKKFAWKEIIPGA